MSAMKAFITQPVASVAPPTPVAVAPAVIEPVVVPAPVAPLAEAVPSAPATPETENPTIEEGRGPTTKAAPRERGEGRSSSYATITFSGKTTERVHKLIIQSLNMPGETMARPISTSEAFRLATIIAERAGGVTAEALHTLRLEDGRVETWQDGGARRGERA